MENRNFFAAPAGRLLGATWFVVQLSMMTTGCGDAAGGDRAADTEPCEIDSSFDAIQQRIFEGRGCTSAACHGGEDPAGGLDLRAGRALENLIRVPGQAAEMELVFPGDEARSLLYVKLAAKTMDAELPVGIAGSPMPFGDQSPAIPEDELSALRAWIRAGASANTIVEGTEVLLACLDEFQVDPNKIEPLDPPAPEVGVQFYSGGWFLPAESEDEVCYATYYDFSEIVPEDATIPCPPNWGEGRRCFTYGRDELAQDAQSHHSIINIFTRDSDPLGDEWGDWTCLGGHIPGEACDPTSHNPCGDGQCTTTPSTSIACIGYPHAPEDFSPGLAQTDVSPCAGEEGCEDGPWWIALSGAQESTFIQEMAGGVYEVIPINGFVSWNSHGFNLTERATTIEQWVNIDYVYAENRSFEREVLFDSSRLFAMGEIAPFEKTEVCMTFTLPQFSRVMTLSSHMHERGEVFRIWEPPNQPCTGGSLLSGDPACRAPDSPAFYESRLYDDPLNLFFEPAMLPLDGVGEASRTFKACAVFDNGADDPNQVKRNSKSFDIATCDELFAQCGCEPADRRCFGGSNEGQPCNGNDDVCGEDGVCDACPLLGGSTTDDEMFLPFGIYYIEVPE